MKLIEVQSILVSSELFEKKFVCDLNACKGACCIEGDSGAPLKLEEIDQLEENLEKITPFMQKEGIDEINKNGVFYMDTENEPVTTLIKNKACAFVFMDEKGIAKCSIEKAFHEGKIEFNKPTSCHLYPIRVQKFYGQEVLNYNHWNICEPACKCGSELEVPVIQFLKGPITRVYGQEFYSELLATQKAWLEQQ